MAPVVSGFDAQSRSLSTEFDDSCPGCVKSFRAAINDVKGVSGDNAKSRLNTAEPVKALNKAGFHVKVKQCRTVAHGQTLMILSWA
jgi:hypothetical protein